MMKIIRDPSIYLVGRQEISQDALAQFMADNDTSWETDTEIGAEQISELSGRLCYMSFGRNQGRKTNHDYLENILKQEHGSVLEHAVWNFIITGVSRSFSHELVRHRAGVAFCLTGDTLIYSDHFASGKRDGVKKRSLKQLFEMTKTPHGRSRIKLLRLRCLDEITLTFTTNKVQAITYSGKKPVFRVELEDGKFIQCSKEHRFYTKDGWQPLHEIVGGLAISPGGLAVYGTTDNPIATNGTPAYKDAEWLRQHYIDEKLEQDEIAALAGVSTHTIRAWIRKHGLQKSPGSWTIGREPWNKGKNYHPGWKHSLETRASLSRQKTGEQNPQWRGGITRQAITLRKCVEDLRPVVLKRDGYCCRICGAKTQGLQIHHILPIWARPDLACEISNLATVCRPCHYEINGCEAEYASLFDVNPVDLAVLQVVPKLFRRRLFRPKLTHIKQITYAGEQDTYDIEMADPHHNFVANGIVTHNSQLSQRYVDESDVDFVEPAVIADDPEMHDIWEASMQQAHTAYLALADRLATRIEAEHPDLSKRERRKMAREAARSVLPNATETKIAFSANTRALRHIIELRGAAGTEPEIRRFSVKMLRLMQEQAPNLFGDMEVVTLPDGSEGVNATYHKV